MYPSIRSSVTEYSPSLSVTVVPVEDPGNESSLTFVPSTYIVKSAEVFASLPTTFLITVKRGAISSFVIVHVIFSPGKSVTLSPSSVGHPSSPVNDTDS